jgi:hypothetical protein
MLSEDLELNYFLLGVFHYGRWRNGSGFFPAQMSNWRVFYWDIFSFSTVPGPLPSSAPLMAPIMNSQNKLTKLIREVIMGSGLQSVETL